MPKARRAQVYHFTKVTKKVGVARKVELVDKVRQALAEYRYCHVVELSHMKTTLLQAIRDALKPDGVVFMTKNRLLQRALGVSAESSAEENIYKLSGLVEGATCLVSANLTAAELIARVQPLLDAANATLALAGDVATETVVLRADEQPLAQYPFSMETQFRALGAPTHLDNGKILLLGDYEVCHEGEELNKLQAQMLKLLGYSLAMPSFIIKGSYDKQGAKVAFTMGTH